MSKYVSQEIRKKLNWYLKVCDTDMQIRVRRNERKRINLIYGTTKLDSTTLIESSKDILAYIVL